MSSDARTDQSHLTPEQRRAMLRAFADRMQVKITQMDDPEDPPGVERAVRVAAVIERLYSRCDRAERGANDGGGKQRKPSIPAPPPPPPALTSPALCC